MKVEIRRQVPIPKPIQNRRNGMGRKNIYPWKELQIGDCFIVDVSSQQMSKIISARHRDHHEKYVRRAIDGKQWVWRVK
jgi:hypothetical protein